MLTLNEITILAILSSPLDCTFHLIISLNCSTEICETKSSKSTVHRVQESVIKTICKMSS